MAYKQQSNNEMTIYIKTKDLIDYTFNITENKNFPKKARFVFVNRIQNIVLDIYSILLKVNEIPISDRKALLIEALSNIKTLLFLIENINKKYKEIFEGDGLNGKINNKS